MQSCVNNTSCQSCVLFVQWMRRRRCISASPAIAIIPSDAGSGTEEHHEYARDTHGVTALIPATLGFHGGCAGEVRRDVGVKGGNFTVNTPTAIRRFSTEQDKYL